MAEHVYLIEDDGTIYSNGGLNLQNFQSKFYSVAPNQYDFVLVYTSSLVPGHLWFNGFWNDVTNIGKGIFGIPNKLKGIIDLLDLTDPVFDANKYMSYAGEMHEIGHQWLAYAGVSQGWTPHTPRWLLGRTALTYSHG